MATARSPHRSGGGGSIPRRVFSLLSPAAKATKAKKAADAAVDRARRGAVRAVRERGYCMQFCRTGACDKAAGLGGSCPHVHDPTKVGAG